MKLMLLTVLLCITMQITHAQNNLERPKLVVGIVVDQMRWDYLYRYYSRYAADGGFKRLIGHGFSCDNTMIPYAQSVTACGHAAIYTGSVPAINGITGNSWYDYELKQPVYCTGDDSVSTVGSLSENGKMSPHRLLVTTVCDELNLATNFHSKIIGVALKDRGSILPAGHSANAAYWYDVSNGNWISSTYYMQQLPKWVTDFNSSKMVDKMYAEGWKTLYPPGTYTQSSADKSGGSNTAFGAGNHFPYQLTQFISKNYGAVEATPHGNKLTFEVAKAALLNEQLGADSITDFLAISLSTPDYIGHTFGPNSIEAEDCFLRLDKELGDFLNYLDAKVGKNQYLLFLSADHGVSQVPSFLQYHKIPAGNYNAEKMLTALNALLLDKFHSADIILDITNEQVYLDRQLLLKNNINKSEVDSFIISYLQTQPFVTNAFETKNIAAATLNSTVKEKFVNGYYPQRSGDIQMITKPQWIDGFENTGTTHGTWAPYDTHIPLLWYGWKIKQGRTTRPISMIDIAPTLSSMLHIQFPGGCIGQPITEVEE